MNKRGWRGKDGDGESVFAVTKYSVCFNEVLTAPSKSFATRCGLGYGRCVVDLADFGRFYLGLPQLEVPVGWEIVPQQ